MEIQQEKYKKHYLFINYKLLAGIIMHQIGIDPQLDIIILQLEYQYCQVLIKGKQIIKQLFAFEKIIDIIIFGNVSIIEQMRVIDILRQYASTYKISFPKIQAIIGASKDLKSNMIYKKAGIQLFNIPKINFKIQNILKIFEKQKLFGSVIKQKKDILLLTNFDQINQELKNQYTIMRGQHILKMNLNHLIVTPQLQTIDHYYTNQYQLNKINRTAVIQILMKQNVQEILILDQIKNHKNQFRTINKYSIYEFVLNLWFKNNNLSTDMIKNIFQISEEIAFLLLLQEKIFLKEEDIFKNFNKKQIKSEQIITISLLCKSDLKYSFATQSLMQFYAANFIIKNIIKLQYDFSPKVIIKSKNVCKFIQQFFQCHQDKHTVMFDIVLQSRRNKLVQKSSAAAITILNMIGQRFSELDLSQISIPYAILIGGYFNDTNLEQSNLKNVKFERCYCIGAKFNRSDMRGATFYQCSTLDTFQSVSCMDITRSGKQLIIGGNKGKIAIYSIKTMKKLLEFQKEYILVKNIKYYSDQKIIITGHQNATMKIWDAETGNNINILIDSMEFACSTDQKYIAVLKNIKQIHILDQQSLQMIKSISQTDRILSFCYSQNSKMIAVISNNIKIWDIQTGTIIKILQNQKNFQFSKISYLKNQNLLFNDTREKIYIWDMKSYTNTKKLESNSFIFASMCQLSDKKQIITSGNNQIKIWDLQSGQKIWSMYGHTHNIHAVAFATSIDKIVTSSQDKTIKIWESNHFQYFYQLSTIQYESNKKRIQMKESKVQELNHILYRSQNLLLQGIQHENVIALKDIYKTFDEVD